MARLGQRLSQIAQRVVPDPFVLALALTGLVMGLGAYQMSSDGQEAVLGTLLEGWFAGFSGKGGLAFALQMCLVLVTGHAIALSPPVQRVVRALARIPKSTAGAAVMVSATACLAALVHWGLGAIVGAFLAREIARSSLAEGRKLHYPLLGAAAYAGMAVWHGGLSGSAPLKVAESATPLGETTFGSLNLIITGVLVIVIVLTFWALSPREESESVLPESLPPLPEREPVEGSGVVHALQESVWVGGIVGAAGLGILVSALFGDDLKLEINSVNGLFLFTGMMLQGSLREYVEAIADGARGAGAIILQFPFYFGILGVMKVSGLIVVLSDALVSLSSAETFPVLAFLSAGVVNFFVPSGGGQWAVQSDILLTSGGQLGVSDATTIMAFSYGDAWTNMLQPFWALPLLGIMRLSAAKIIGYTTVIFLVMGVVVSTLLLVLA